MVHCLLTDVGGGASLIRSHRFIRFSNRCWWPLPFLRWLSGSCFAFGATRWFYKNYWCLGKCHRRREISWCLWWLFRRCGYNYLIWHCGHPHSQGLRYVWEYRWHTAGIVIDSAVFYFLFAFDFSLSIFCVTSSSVVFPVGNFGRRSAWHLRSVCFSALVPSFGKVRIPDCELSLAWFFDYRGMVIGFDNWRSWCQHFIQPV